MSINIYSIDSIGSQGVSLKSHILAKTINLMILANIIDHLITTIIFLPLQLHVPYTSYLHLHLPQ